MVFFTKIWQSITDFNSYPGFSQQRSGRVVGWFLIFVSLVGLIWIIPSTLSTNAFVKQATGQAGTIYQTKVPPFTLSNGKLEVEGQMPQILFQDEKNLYLIDTSGKTSEDILKDKTQGMLITGDKIYSKQSGAQYREMFFKDFQVDRFTKEDGQVVLNKVLPMLVWLVPLVFLGGITVFILTSLVFLMVMTFVGQLLASVQHLNLSFRNVFNVTAHSMTLPLLVVVATSISPWKIPFSGLACFVLIGVYQWMGFKAIGKQGDGDTPTI